MSSSGSDKVLEVPKDNEKDDQRPLDSREQPPHAETDKPPASSSLPETTQANSPPSVKDATLTTSNPPSGSPASPPDTEKKVTMDGGDTKDDTTNGAVDDEKKQAATAVDTKDSETKPVASNGSALAKDGNGDTKHDKSPSTATATSTLPKDEKTSLEKPAKKKKRKSRNLWRFLNSCFTSSVLEESGTERAKPFSKSSKSKKPTASPTAASKEDEKTKNKNAGLPAEAAPSISSSMGPAHTLNTKPATPSRRSSGIVNGDGDVVIPPAHAPDLLPKAETAGVTSGAVQAPGSTGSEEESEGSVTDEERHRHLEEEDDEERLILNGGNGIPIGPDGKEAPLLPPMAPSHKGRKCLVLDLDETLVHSSFKLIPQADYVVPVEIEWQWHNVYVIKRPGVDAFLKRMGELYEVVVFTASLSKYADPVLDKLDIHKVVSHRLFRESCYLHKGNYVKDLSQLGRPIGDTIILDNSPASYIFHPNNAVPVSSWFNDPHDTELTDMSPFLADLAEVADIRGVLDGGI